MHHPQKRVKDCGSHASGADDGDEEGPGDLPDRALLLHSSRIEERRVVVREGCAPALPEGRRNATRDYSLGGSIGGRRAGEREERESSSLGFVVD